MPAPSERAPAPSIPAATRSEIECSGFISSSGISSDVQVFDGSDNDTRSPYREFATGSVVYLRSGTQEASLVGTEYRLIRPATTGIVAGARLPTFGRATWYRGQGFAIGSLGQAYEDVGRVKVTAVTPHGLVAQVTFACRLVALNDLAIPFQPREIPSYDPSHKADRFAPMGEGAARGTIIAAAENAGALANGRVAYIDLGDRDGARPGQRYRIVHADRDVARSRWVWHETPPTETVGELVVLFTQERSSVGIVVSNVREIWLGDTVIPQ